MSDVSPQAPADRSSLSELLRSTSAPLLVLFVGTIVDLFANIFVGRLIGPEYYGDYAVALGAATVCAGIANLGVSETLPKFFPLYVDGGRFGLAWGFLRANLEAAVVISALAAAGGAYYYNWLEHLADGHPAAIIWIVVPVLVFNSYFFNFLVAVESEVAMMSMREIAQPVIMIGALYGLVYLQHQVTDHVSVFAFGAALLAMTPFYIASANARLPVSVRRAVPQYDLARWVRVGAPIALAGISCDIFDQIDLQMVEVVDVDEDRVGQFAAAMKIADLVFVVYSAVCLVVAPRLSRLLASGDQAAIQLFAQRIFWIVSAGGALVAIPVIVFHDPLARLFGQGFDGTLAPLVILAAGNVLIGSLCLSWSFLSLGDHEREPIPVIALGLVVLTVILYFVIPHWHLVGAAAAKVAVSVAVYGWMVYRVWRITGVALWRVSRRVPG